MLTLLFVELAFGVNNKDLDNFIIFRESLGSPLLEAYNSSYS